MFGTYLINCATRKFRKEWHIMLLASKKVPHYIVPKKDIYIFLPYLGELLLFAGKLNISRNNITVDSIEQGFIVIAHLPP